jgi:O-acetyl-ADP-ribose deacetylase (regulator of RNase III)
MNGETTLTHPIGHNRIELVLGNIVHQQADAIVNAANTRLSGGGGVDGAIHRAAGKALAQECAAIPADEQGRRCPTGQAVVTGAGNLPARWVIHAVGPFYNPVYADKADRQLREVHVNVLTAAAERGCRIVALPAISTGAYRFPVERAATIALTAAAEFQREHPLPEVVRFVLFKEPAFAAFKEALERLCAGEDSQGN